MEVMTSHGSKYCCLFLTAPSITITLAKIRRMAQKITIIRLRLITLRLDRQYRRQRQTPTIFVNPYKNILISQKIFGIINRYLPTQSTAPDKGPNHQILAKNSSVDNNFLSSIFVISRSQLLTQYRSQLEHVRLRHRSNGHHAQPRTRPGQLQTEIRLKFAPQRKLSHVSCNKIMFISKYRHNMEISSIKEGQEPEVQLKLPGSLQMVDTRSVSGSRSSKRTC